MSTPRRAVLAVSALALVAACCGCHGSRQGDSQRGNLPPKDRIRHVVCLFDSKPWLNLDRAGDRDPEGLLYRVYLKTADDRGVLRDGRFDVEMYRIDRDAQGKETRTLAADWHYPTGAFDVIDRAGVLGQGYILKFSWRKDMDLPGSEIEIVTVFTDEYGNTARSSTYCLRIPKGKT
jgi:hypothetical protein